MLAADKLQLQSAMKQQATALKEKEFNLHHSNFMTVGTQAAVLAGLDITMFIEFNPSSNAVWGDESAMIPRVLKFMYYVMIVSAFCANLIVVSHTTTLSVLGAGLALRGPDGSMVTATDGLYDERKSVFFSFGVGLACTVGSLFMCVWLALHWEAALICMFVTLYTCFKIHQNYRRVVQRFGFDESETVNFDDIFYGPAAIQVVRTGLRTLRTTLSGQTKKSKNSNREFVNGSGDISDDSDDSPRMQEWSGGVNGSKRRGPSRGENFV